MSGGERARLALALITRDAPHMLILDEPTNHLDVDAREALIQALNAYSGAVVMVSHDRHMLEMTADRLVLVDGGTAKEFDGSLDDYIAFVLTKDAADAAKSDSKGNRKEARRAAAEAREKGQALRRRAREARRSLPGWPNSAARSIGRCSIRLRRRPELSTLRMTGLMKRRAELDTRSRRRGAWLEASEALELAAA